MSSSSSSSASPRQFPDFLLGSSKEGISSTCSPPACCEAVENHPSPSSLSPSSIFSPYSVKAEALWFDGTAILTSSEVDSLEYLPCRKIKTSSHAGQSPWADNAVALSHELTAEAQSKIWSWMQRRMVLSVSDSLTDMMLVWSRPERLYLRQAADTSRLQACVWSKARLIQFAMRSSWYRFAESKPFCSP